MRNTLFFRGFNYLAKREMLNWMSDKAYIDLMFQYRIGKKIDWKNPKTFNEKLQWLKLYDRRPEYHSMVDKYEAKLYVSSQIGEQYIIPTLGLWDSVEEIDFVSLPDSFVLKCTHDSGSIVLCPDKKKFNKEAAFKKLNHGLNRDMFYWGREWPYKGLKRRIIAETYMRDESKTDLKDYKVLCFNGEPKLIELHQQRNTKNQTQDYYDTNWNLTEITQNSTHIYKESKQSVEKPAALEEMLALSARLSQGIPQLRVDWYSISGRLYFGELTFFDGSGFEPYDKYEDDLMLGSWITLPHKV